MAARPSWEGHLRLSLVTCPVALYPATSEAETVRFNLINPATGNRILPRNWPPWWVYRNPGAQIAVVFSPT